MKDNSMLIAIILLLVSIILLLVADAHAQVAVGWTDMNDPVADYCILYRSTNPDTGFLVLDFVTPLEGTAEYMYTDTTIAEGVPYYYRVAIVRDLDHSELSPWARALWRDKSGGVRTYYAHDFWPGMNQRNMLVVYTPIPDCELIWQWNYLSDLIAVKCAPFVGTVPTPALEPQ